MRKDMGDVFFVAVGTKHLRLASTDENSREIAHRIRDAWGVRVKDNASSVAGEQFSTIPLPPKMREFVADFDAGRLPELEAHIGELEKARFSELAGRVWNMAIGPSRRTRQSKLSGDSRF